MATIGLDKLFYAKITEDDNGDETYASPMQMAKAMSADLSVELAEATLYADDGAAEIVKEFKSGTLSLGVDDIGAAVASDLTGANIDANGVVISTSEDGGDPVAVGFRAKKANGKYKYYWLYRVKFGIPATNLATKGDSITFSTPTIICHSEGAKLGIASNHGDVMHWFPKHGKSMDTFRADVKDLLGQATDPKPTEPTAPATPTTGAIELGSKVKFKASAEKYNPTTKAIPAWVKDDYYHIVTQTTVSGKPVVKGGKTCVLLGKKVKKSTGETQSGINTWVALDNLELVEGAPTEAPAYRVHTVVKGDTLWDLAKKYLGDGSRYPEIKALNGLTSNVIYSGWKLKIPN